MYDPSCQDLAEYFLADEPYTSETAARQHARVVELAQVIQDAIEAWLALDPDADDEPPRP